MIPEELTLDAVLTLLRRFWYVIPMLALGVALMLANHNLSNARAKLQQDADFRTELQSMMHAKSDKMPVLLNDLGVIITNSNNRKTALDQISHNAQQSAKRSKADDADLKRQLAAYRSQYALAERRIKDLELRKTAGNLLDDWKILENDTKAAWENWK